MLWWQVGRKAQLKGKQPKPPVDPQGIGPAFAAGGRCRQHGHPAATFARGPGPFAEDAHDLRVLAGKLCAKLGDSALAPRCLATEPGGWGCGFWVLAGKLSLIPRPTF